MSHNRLDPSRTALTPEYQLHRYVPHLVRSGETLLAEELSQTVGELLLALNLQVQLVEIGRTCRLLKTLVTSGKNHNVCSHK